MNYTLSYSCVKIVVNELMHSYHDAEKFIGYCKECDRYNACWACPPFDFNADEYLAPFTHFIGQAPLVSGFFSVDEFSILTLPFQGNLVKVKGSPATVTTTL